MKTTIDIPKSDLEEAMNFVGTRTKREAVVTAIRFFNRRQRAAKAAGMLGTFEDFMTREELFDERERG